MLEEPAEVVSVVEVEVTGYWTPELQNVKKLHQPSNIFAQIYLPFLRHFATLLGSSHQGRNPSGQRLSCLLFCLLLSPPCSGHKRFKILHSSLLQVALAPVKMFSTYLLDNEETQHLDGVRDIVKMLKKLGTLFGLRRKVDQGQKKENHLREPRLRSEDLHGAIFEKHTEL